MFKFSVAALLVLCPLVGDAAELSFEVASVKASAGEGEVNNRPAEERVRFGAEAVSLSNVTLVTCLKEAYGIYSFQISGPTWMRYTRYDITAKAGSAATRDQMRLMLRALIAERFHLTFHEVRKDLKVYSLTEGKGGNRLRQAAGPGDKAMAMEGGAIVFRNYSMGDLIETLSNVPFRLDRPVVDMTGLEGRYDFELKIAPDELAMKHAFEGMSRQDGDGPTLIDLIQAQLGLRFGATERSMDVLTVDAADKTPTEN